MNNLECCFFGCLASAIFFTFLLLLNMFGVPLWVMGAVFLWVVVALVRKSILRDRQAYRVKVCPTCAQRTLSAIYKFVCVVYYRVGYEGPRHPRYHICVSCGTQVVHHLNGEWKVCRASEWEAMEDWERHRRIGEPLLDANSTAINRFDDAVVAYHVIDENEVVLVWRYHDIQTIGAIVLTDEAEQIEPILRVLEKADVPQIFLNKSELESWVGQWNQDTALRACLEKSPNIGADFVGPAIIMDYDFFDAEPYHRNRKAIECLWQLSKEPEARQQVIKLAVWTELAWRACGLNWR